MDLEEFVRQTIEQVIRGVKNAHEVANAHGSGVGSSSKLHVIEFDVAVTVAEGAESTKGGGIKVAGITFGATGKDEQRSSSISRVKFDVPIRYPANVRTAGVVVASQSPSASPPRGFGNH